MYLFVYIARVDTLSWFLIQKIQKDTETLPPGDTALPVYVKPLNYMLYIGELNCNEEYLNKAAEKKNKPHPLLLPNPGVTLFAWMHPCDLFSFAPSIYF